MRLKQTPGWSDLHTPGREVELLPIMVMVLPLPAGAARVLAVNQRGQAADLGTLLASRLGLLADKVEACNP